MELIGYQNPCEPYTNIPIWLRITEPILLKRFDKIDEKARTAAATAAMSKAVVSWDGSNIKHYPSWTIAARYAGVTAEALQYSYRRGKKCKERYWIKLVSI